MYLHHFNKKIQEIAEGHPVSTKLLINNYQRINFDKIKDFDLKDAETIVIHDFYNRVIKEIFSKNKEPLTLLNNLAVINTDLHTNIDKETVIKTYKGMEINAHFNTLIDTGMLKKKEGRQGIYEFTFKHIQDALEEEAEQVHHKKAIKYYHNKKKELKESYSTDDDVELLFHKIRIEKKEQELALFNELVINLHPADYGFRRIIDIGEEMRNSYTNGDKAQILNKLAAIYTQLERFRIPLSYYKEIITHYHNVPEERRDNYLNFVATAWVNLGGLYIQLSKYKESEDSFKKGLDLYRQLDNIDNKNIARNLPGIANIYLNLGVLYSYLKRVKESENAYKKALKIYGKIDPKYRDKFLPYISITYSNLGTVYENQRKFKGAEIAFRKALTIDKELSRTNPQAYITHSITILNNLGMLYIKLKNVAKAELAFREALNLSKSVVEKNKDTFVPYVARILKNLTILSIQRRQFKAAIDYANESISSYTYLAIKNPDVYKDEVLRLKQAITKLKKEKVPKIFNAI